MGSGWRLMEAKKAMDDIKLDIRLAWNTRAPILSSEEVEKLSHG